MWNELRWALTCIKTYIKGEKYYLYLGSTVLQNPPAFGSQKWEVWKHVLNYSHFYFIYLLIYLLFRRLWDSLWKLNTRETQVRMKRKKKDKPCSSPRHSWLSWGMSVTFKTQGLGGLGEVGECPWVARGHRLGPGWQWASEVTPARAPVCPV